MDAKTRDKLDQIKRWNWCRVREGQMRQLIVELEKRLDEYLVDPDMQLATTGDNLAMSALTVLGDLKLRRRDLADALLEQNEIAQSFK